jgi:hypothetical protein
MLSTKKTEVRYAGTTMQPLGERKYGTRGISPTSGYNRFKPSGLSQTSAACVAIFTHACVQVLSHAMRARRDSSQPPVKTYLHGGRIYTPRGRHLPRREWIPT